MTTNLTIAQIFNDIAELLELKEENPFKIRAYRNGAQTLENLTEDVHEVARREELTKLPGIGKDLSEKIKEFLTAHKIKYYDQLKKEIPQVLIDMKSIPGIGPKKALLLHKKLKIKNLGELEKKCSEHKLQTLPGIRAKTEENILKGLEFLKKSEGRFSLENGVPLADEIIRALKKLKEVKRISVAGSVRRRKDTIHDVDILVTAQNSAKVMETFVGLPVVSDVIAEGDTKSSIRTINGLQADLRVVDPAAYGACLLYFTGSKAHNIRIRDIAKKKGYKLNEYGLFSEKNDKLIASKSEEEIYKILGMECVPPELREDHGEVEVALKHALPHLVTEKQIRGDFHSHTNESDGENTLEEMAESARKHGLEYLVVTDHSKSLTVANGLTEKRLMARVEAIRKLNKKLKGLTLLTGSEVDILADGVLDYSDDVLKELDFVVASIHSGFKQPREKMTQRILKAMDNKYVNLIGHPTGRLIGIRDAYDVDVDKMIRHAKATNTALEINAHPKRLDLNEVYIRQSVDAGVTLAIATDSHAVNQFDNLTYGVSEARRGWCESKNILNTLTLAELRKKIRK
ncbi:MAG: DNA polymerase/3'-5' exonuclease PolX [Candidatus Omnitrophica bacterium]|nr:DNA polymerase/3'-5' exonuclease PolX [Candidatus Omnitrophota bacterium]